MQTTNTEARALTDKLFDCLARLENLPADASPLVRESLETERDLLNARAAKVAGLQVG